MTNSPFIYQLIKAQYIPLEMIIDKYKKKICMASLDSYLYLEQ